MDNDLHNEQLIEDFLNGNLSQSQQKDFENRLAAEPELAEQVDLHRLTVEGLKQYEGQQFKEKVISVDELLEKEGFFEYDSTEESVEIPNKTVKSIGWRKYLTYAAGFLLLASIGFYFLNSNNSSSEKRLARFYEKAPDLISGKLSRRLNGLATKDKVRWIAFSHCMERYNGADQKMTTPCLESYLQKYPADLEARLYLGLALLDLKSYEEAILQFGQLKDLEGSEWESMWRWNHALALVGAGRERDAGVLLGRIEVGDVYYGRVLRLRGELE